MTGFGTFAVCHSCTGLGVLKWVLLQGNEPPPIVLYCWRNIYIPKRMHVYTCNIHVLVVLDWVDRILCFLLADYCAMYQQSIERPDEFWTEKAYRFLNWDEKFKKVKDCNNEEGIVRWFTDGKLNVSSKSYFTDVCAYSEYIVHPGQILNAVWWWVLDAASLYVHVHVHICNMEWHCNNPSRAWWMGDCFVQHHGVLAWMALFSNNSARDGNWVHEMPSLTTHETLACTLFTWLDCTRHLFTHTCAMILKKDEYPVFLCILYIITFSVF